MLRIVNEPTAAALAYGLDKPGNEEVIAVYDLGGGTFDVSILRVGEGVIEVLATNGDTFLGGDDFDRAVMDWIIDEFKKDQGIDLRTTGWPCSACARPPRRRRSSSRRTQTTEINLPFITAAPSGPVHLQMTLTRSKLEQLTRDLIERTTDPVSKALDDAKVEAADVDEVVLVGGQTRMPAVQDAGQETVQRQGAAQGRQPGRGGGGRCGDPGRRPRRRRQGRAAARCHATVARRRDQGRRHDRPDPAQYDHPDAQERDLLDRRRQPVPGRGPRPPGRAAAREREQEPRPVHARRHPAGPARDPQIEVAFDIDANGILNVSAKDKATGKEQRVVIKPSSGLSEAEIQRMVRDAEQHAAEDAQRREEVELRNRADNLAYAAERTLRESGDSLPSELKLQIDDLVQTIRRALDSRDVAAARTATEPWSRRWPRAAEAPQPVGAAAGGSRAVAAVEVTEAAQTARRFGRRRVPRGVRCRSTSDVRRSEQSSAGTHWTGWRRSSPGMPVS